MLDADYAPLVIDWRAPAAAPFYRSTPVEPGRVLRRRVIRSKGRRVLGVEDDLLRPELDTGLPVVGDGALMASLGRARSHTMRDIVSTIQAEQDEVIRAPAAGVTEVAGGPGTGKTAVALHRAAYLLYQDRRRYAGGILVVSPTAAAGRVHRGRAAVARRGGPGRDPRGRLAGRRHDGRPRTTTRPSPGSRARCGCCRCCATPPAAAWTCPAARRTAARPGCGWSPSAAGSELDGQPSCPWSGSRRSAAPPRSTCAAAGPPPAAGRAVAQVRPPLRRRRTGRRGARGLRRGRRRRAGLPRLHGRLVAGAGAAPGAGRARRREAARPLGPPGAEHRREVEGWPRSIRSDEFTVHDVALLDELNHAPRRRPGRQGRELDPPGPARPR